MGTRAELGRHATVRGAGPRGHAISVDGHYLYASSYDDDTVWVLKIR